MSDLVIRSLVLSATIMGDLPQSLAADFHTNICGLCLSFARLILTNSRFRPGHVVGGKLAPAEPDRWCWKPEKCEEYAVKSGYRLQKERQTGRGQSGQRTIQENLE